MYRSLLCQIFAQLPQLQSCVSYQFEGPPRDHWPIEILENVFRDAVRGLGQSMHLTCYIDALDECYDDEGVRIAVGCFQDLSKIATSENAQFWICPSSRYYPHITMQKHSELRFEDQEGHLDDISQYLQDKFLIAEPSKQQLGEEIRRRCSGVFLWVVLVVNIINKEDGAGSDAKKLGSTLESVPPRLNDLFSKILEEPDSAIVVALQWVLFARRRLSVPELYFAIRTGTGDLETALWNKQDIDTERLKRYVIHRSRGLIEVVNHMEAVGFSSSMNPCESIFFLVVWETWTKA